MGKRKSYQLTLLFLTTLALLGCKKYEVNTNRLTKQGSWEVTQLLIDHNAKSSLPRWNFEATATAGEFANANWKHSDGSSAPFLWRFNYYAGTFEFQLGNVDSSTPMNKAHLQCKNLSGEYNILTDKRKLFEFESIQTSGYGNLPVFIQLTPY